jgi:hypothetical protein
LKTSFHWQPEDETLSNQITQHVATQKVIAPPKSPRIESRFARDTRTDGEFARRRSDSDEQLFEGTVMRGENKNMAPRSKLDDKKKAEIEFKMMSNDAISSSFILKE